LESECCCGCFAVAADDDDVVSAGFGAAVSDFTFLVGVALESGLGSLVPLCFGAPGAVDPFATDAVAAGFVDVVGRDFLELVVVVDTDGIIALSFEVVLVAVFAAPPVPVVGEGFPLAELGNFTGPDDETLFSAFVSFDFDTGGVFSTTFSFFIISPF